MKGGRAGSAINGIGNVVGHGKEILDVLSGKISAVKKHLLGGKPVFVIGSFRESACPGGQVWEGTFRVVDVVDEFLVVIDTGKEHFFEAYCCFQKIRFMIGKSPA